MKQEIKGIKNKDIDEFFDDDNDQSQENILPNSSPSHSLNFTPVKVNTIGILDEFASLITELFPDEKLKPKKQKQVRALLEQF